MSLLTVFMLYFLISDIHISIKSLMLFDVDSRDINRWV